MVLGGKTASTPSRQKRFCDFPVSVFIVKRHQADLSLYTLLISYLFPPYTCDARLDFQLLFITHVNESEDERTEVLQMCNTHAI